MTDAENSNKKPFIQFNLRIPVLLKKVLEKAGSVSHRSQNEEMVYRLKNFTTHEKMIEEIRSDMSELKANQNEIKEELKALKSVFLDKLNK